MTADIEWREEAIGRHHDRQGFDCGSPALNDYLQRHARQNHRSGGAKTFVAVAPAEPARILGYYSISPGAIEFARVPAPMVKGLGRYEVPVYRLGRLAVSRSMQGRGLGGELLLSAGKRALAVASEVGGVALAIDAKDEPAAGWYARFGALRLLDDPLKLILPLSTVAEAIEAVGQATTKYKHPAVGRVDDEAQPGDTVFHRHDSGFGMYAQAQCRQPLDDGPLPAPQLALAVADQRQIVHIAQIALAAQNVLGSLGIHQMTFLSTECQSYAIVLQLTASETTMANLAPVSVRVSARERELLEAAAEQARTNLSDFIRRKAVEAAETDLFFGTTVTIPAEHWKKFETWAQAPAKAVPGLADLAKTRPEWQD